MSRIFNIEEDFIDAVVEEQRKRSFFEDIYAEVIDKELEELNCQSIINEVNRMHYEKEWS